MLPARPRSLAGALLALALCLAQPARAESGLDALYEDAKADLAEERFELALQKFHRCAELAEGALGQVWQMWLGIALTYEKMGRAPQAIEYYQRFIHSSERDAESMGAKWQQRREVARETVRGLERQVLETHALLSVTSEPEGAQVWIDGKLAGAEGDARTPFGAYVEPGEHEVKVVGDAGVSAEAKVEAAVGKVHPVRFDLATGLSEVRTVDQGADNGLALGLTLGGGALVAGGLVLTLLALEDHDEAEGLDPALGAQGEARYQELRDAQAAKETASWVLYGVGGAAVVTGVILFVVGGGDDDLSVAPDPRGGALATWRF